MKKTIKNTKITAIVLAAVLAATSLMSCQNALMDVSDEEPENQKVSSVARVAKTDSEKIDDIYNKMNKPKGWKYQGEKIAATRLLGEVTSMLPIDKIENPELRILAKIGTRTLAVGTAALDKYLNNYTCGLYGVATSIFWPSKEEPDPAIQAINDKLCEVETKLNDMDNKMTEGMEKIQSSIIHSSDKAYLRSRHEQLVKMQKYIQKPEIINHLRGSKDGNITFSNYMSVLSALTGDTPFSGSIPDILTEANTMYTLYTTKMTGDDSFDKICDRYARSVNAWGYEYDSTMRSFATCELLTSTQIFNILKAVYSPYLADNHVNYNYEVMQLLVYAYSMKGSLYSNMMDMINGQLPKNKYPEYTFTYNAKIVTPDTFFEVKSDTKMLYEYLLAFLCKSEKAVLPEEYVDVVFGGMDINKIKGMDGIYEDAATRTKIVNLDTYSKARKAGFDRWTEHVELYDKYVNEVNKLYDNLVNDDLGYVTCMIPGVERTFLKTMGFVRFGKRTYSHLGMGWTKDTTHINKIFHGQDICGDWSTYGEFHNSNVRDCFTKNLQKDVYKKDYDKLTKKTFCYMTEKEYEKIYSWYRDADHSLYKSVPVTYADDEGNVLKIEKNINVDTIRNPSFNEIFYYGAGIGLKFDVKKQNNGWVIYTPMAVVSDESDVLGIADGKWDAADGAKPAELNNLFQIGVDYAYEEGRPVSKLVDEHKNIFTSSYPFNEFGIVEYRVESYCLNGVKKDSCWNENSLKRTNWIVTSIPNEREKNTPEEALKTCKYYREYAKLCTSPTYIFPSVVHEMSWNTYWNKRNHEN